MSRPLPSMMTSDWLHENSIPKIGCDYFLAGPIPFPKNTLPIWTLGYCRSPKHSRILKNVCCSLWTEAKFGSFLSCGWLPLRVHDKIWKRGEKRSARCGVIMWPCQYGPYQLEPQEWIPRLDVFGRVHHQGFFGVGLWLVTPTKVFLLNCFLKIAKKAGVRQSGSEITNSFTILTLLAMCRNALIILKKKNMSILTIYPHSVVGHAVVPISYTGSYRGFCKKILEAGVLLRILSIS